jgi:hypothetical protein
MNFSHKMEPFDTNIDRFSGLYRCQQYFSLSTTEIQ